MSVLVPAVLLALAVIVFVLYPVVFGQFAPMDREDDELTEAQHRKKIALLALRDVEYDYLAGKLDEPDYRKLKQEIASEALEAIDTEEAEWVAREAVARAEGRPSESAEVSAAIEAEIAALRASIREGVICSQCGHPNASGSRFCGDCGSALPGAAREAVGGR